MSSLQPGTKRIIRGAILKLYSDEYRNCLETNSVSDIWRVTLSLIYLAEELTHLIFSPTLSFTVTHFIWKPPSTAAAPSSAASLEQLLIKCLAQGHPRVIGPPPPPHTHTQNFQILHFGNSSSCDQTGGFFFLPLKCKIRDNESSEGGKDFTSRLLLCNATSWQ